MPHCLAHTHLLASHDKRRRHRKGREWEREQLVGRKLYSKHFIHVAIHWYEHSGGDAIAASIVDVPRRRRRCHHHQHRRCCHCRTVGVRFTRDKCKQNVWKWMLIALFIWHRRHSCLSFDMQAFHSNSSDGYSLQRRLHMRVQFKFYRIVCASVGGGVCVWRLENSGNESPSIHGQLTLNWMWWGRVRCDIEYMKLPSTFRIRNLFLAMPQSLLLLFFFHIQIWH